MNVKFFGREPALFLGLIAVTVQVVSAFWVHVTVDQQAVVNAASAAVVGVIVAIVAHDSLSAPILGAAQAVMSLAVGFGQNWAPDKQATVLALVSALVAVFVRQVVTAPTGAPTAPQHFG
jgi:hypothetical protein